MAPVAIRFLGPFEVVAPYRDPGSQIGTKAVLLLARLSLPPGQYQDRKRLTELLWPDRGEAQAQASLRQTLWTLRKVFGETDPAVLHSDRTALRLDPAAVEIDTIVFEALVKSGGKESLERAAELYRGAFLHGIDLDDGDEFELFRFERARLLDMALSCCRSLIGLRLAAEDSGGALDIARRSLSYDPLQEEVHAAIIRILRDQGNLSLAREQYEACRNLLRKELDAAPSDELESLRRSLGAAPRGLTGLTIASPPERPPAIVPVAAAPAPLPLSRSMAAAGPAPRRWTAGILLVAAAVALILPRLPGENLAVTAKSESAGAKKTLAVLPFTALGTDATQDIFAAGLTGDLLADLTKVSGLLVLSSDSGRAIAMSRGGSMVKGADLGVDYLVEGTVFRTGDRIHVNAELLEVASGAAIWAEAYDRKTDELFAVQDDVVQKIAEKLAVPLTEAERRTINRIPTASLEAYDFYQRAEFRPLGLSVQEAFLRAIPAYRRAIELDPSFAEAWAGYASEAAAIWRFDYSELMPSSYAKEEAYAAAGRALKLDPENARAFGVLAIIQAVEGEHDLAMQSARRAVELRPSDDVARETLANVLFLAGDLDGAEAEISLARRLEANPSIALRLISGTVAFSQKRYEDAIVELEAALPVVPRSELILEHLAAAHAYLGHADRAATLVKELERALEITNLHFYKTLRDTAGTAEQQAHFLEGLRRAGVPEWPYHDQRPAASRLTGEDLKRVVAGPVWIGELYNGHRFIQQFDRSGGFAYRSDYSLLSGRIEMDGDSLCQRIDGYLRGHSTCGFVYRRTAADPYPGRDFVYVSIDSVKFFSVSD